MRDEGPESIDPCCGRRARPEPGARVVRFGVKVKWLGFNRTLQSGFNQARLQWRP